MNYDIKIINPDEGVGLLEFDRVKFLVHHLKNIAKKSLLLQLFGYSGVYCPPEIKKQLNIYLYEVKEDKNGLNFALKADQFQRIPLQLKLFEDTPELENLTPIALVIQSFRVALSNDSDKNMIDEPLIKELVGFKKFFKHEKEKILLTNNNTFPEVEISRKRIEKIERLRDSIPEAQMTMVAGILDEMKFSKEEVVLTTLDHEKMIVKVKKNLFTDLKKYFGREITITGMAYFKPGGQLSHIEMEKFDAANSHLMKMFSKKPHKRTAQQQIAFQLQQGKEADRIDDIIGKWPGDESIDDLLNMLKNLE